MTKAGYRVASVVELDKYVKRPRVSGSPRVQVSLPCCAGVPGILALCMQILPAVLSCHPLVFIAMLIACQKADVKACCLAELCVRRPQGLEGLLSVPERYSSQSMSRRNSSSDAQQTAVNTSEPAALLRAARLRASPDMDHTSTV